MPLIPRMDTPETKALWEFIIRTKQEVANEIPAWRIEQEAEQRKSPPKSS